MRHNKKILYAFFVILLAGIILGGTAAPPRLKPVWPASGWTRIRRGRSRPSRQMVVDLLLFRSSIPTDRGVNEAHRHQLVKRRADLDVLPRRICTASAPDKIRNGRQPLVADWWWVDDTTSGGTTTFESRSLVVAASA